MTVDPVTLDLIVRYLERVNPRGQEEADQLDWLVIHLRRGLRGAA